MENPNYDEIILKLEDELSQLKKQIQDFVLLVENAMGLCNRAIRDMREIVMADGFSELNDEIYFFRHIKPKVSSKLIFYTELFHIESYRPLADRKIQIAYFRDVAKRLCVYFSENKEFYQYYKRGKTFSDHLYFVRGKTDNRIHEDSILNHFDPKFSTGYDLTLSKFMAYEQLQKYTNNEIEKLNNQVSFNSQAEWTGQRVDAVELIYALVSVGVINHGNIGIKELARLFEKMFNIKLDDIYRVFQDIQGRTTVKTKFLDQLKEALLNRLDDLDK
jgi:hypothetical protein